jgi:hypothetical protein
MWWAALLNTILGAFSSGVAAATGSYESIATATASGSATTLTFTSIPSTYKHLQIRGISKNSGTGSAASTFTAIFNSDNSANYAWHYIDANGTAATASGGASDTAITLRRGSSTNNASYTNMFGSIIIDVHDYASTTKNKTVRYIAGTDYNNTSGALALGSNLWMSTNAITSITLTSGSGNWVAGTTFALYGIKG